MRSFLVLLGMALAGCDDSPSQPDANLGIDTIAADPQIVVTGTVTNAVNGTPIDGASISVPGRGVDTTTDAQGNYTFTLETAGYAPFIHIRVVKTGYLETYYWPGILTTNASGMGIAMASTAHRDSVYGAAGRTSDQSKLFVRVEVTDGGAPLDGVNLESRLPSAAMVATDANGIGYLLDAPMYFNVKATKGPRSTSTLYYEAYEQNGQFVIVRVAMD